MQKIQLGMLATAGLMAACSTNTKKEEPKTLEELLGYHPNILWLSCEDIGPALGCYGDSVAITPNLDKMASQGIRYTQAHTVAGVCAPSRCSIITGMYPVSIGGHNMRTTNINQKGQDLLGLPKGYSIVPPAEVKCFPEFLRAAGYYCTNNNKMDYQFHAPETAWDECSRKAHYRNRKPGQPFFAVFNFITSHESRIWTQGGEPLLSNYDAIKIPPYHPEHPQVRMDYARKYSNITEMDLQVGHMLDQLEREGLLDSTIVFFWSDHGGMLPREKRELHESGLHVPLIVRFPHEWMAGTVDDQLINFVDLAPTVLSLAGIQIPEYIQGQAFLGAHKSEAPRKYMYGARDRMDGNLDRVRSVSDGKFKYMKHYYPDLPYVQEINYRKQIGMMNVLYDYHAGDSLQGTAALWWRETKDPEELFDLENDPFEFINLANDPAYADKLNELRQELKNFQEKYGDWGEVPEKDMIKQMWGGDTQPSTHAIVFTKKDNKLEISCPTKGASIAYQIIGVNEKDHYSLYTGPIELKAGQKVRAKAMRIGYKETDIAYFEM